MQTGGFTEDTICRIAGHRERVIDAPVIDRWRFRERQFAPSIPGAIDKAVEDLRANAPRYDRLASSLANPASVETLRQLMMFRALGPCRYALPLSREVDNAYRRAEAVRTAPSDRKFPPFEFATYRVPFFFGETIELEAWQGNIVCSFVFEQYFYKSVDATVRPGTGDIVIDAGACFGDTALALTSATGCGLLTVNSRSGFGVMR